MKAEVLFFYKNKLGPREEKKKWYKSQRKKKKPCFRELFQF